MFASLIIRSLHEVSMRVANRRAIWVKRARCYQSNLNLSDSHAAPAHSQSALGERVLHQ